MLLKVFQLYPYSSIIDLITRFFEIYSEWDWENPVTLKYFIGDFCEISHYDIDNFSNKANSPMKIINPVYNCNSTFYVDNSNLELIKIELSRAKNIINQITNNCQDWSLLFKEKIIR
jgi:poly(A) polymerase Pap1